MPERSGAGRILKENGFIEIVPPLHAGEAGWKGPLSDGELDKAKAFGKAVAAELAADKPRSPPAPESPKAPADGQPPSDPGK